MKLMLLIILALTACQPQSAAPADKDPQQTTGQSAEQVVENKIIEEPAVPENVIDTTKSVSVVKVVLTSANGSLPPPHQYSNSVEFSAENDPNFDKLVSAALDQTRVNDAATLREYMTLYLHGDYVGYNKIRELSAGDVHPKGGESRSVKFITADGGKFQISNFGERFTGDGLTPLKSAAHEKGVTPDDSLSGPGPARP